MPSRFLLGVMAIGALAVGPALPAQAGQTNVAVAANFTEAAKEIAKAFQAKTGDEAVLSFGSTGQLYTQISQGAPFEVFLAADEARPRKAVDEGLVRGRRMETAGPLVRPTDGHADDRMPHAGHRRFD